ncbi:SHOCT domain-containing protein [Butyrivibrio fibrisolvens]|uniref:SHOCT domain-containing protein n=1 Tax=Butyrivibrio fibrisolvens TaxID=831 RepID=UPI000685DEDC|nr:SHOCT domain-containing protein [Butyrivibrio fibrisolvens]
MTFVIIMSWLIMCIVVGAVAQSIGRSFGSYFCISLLLSPLIGFIILAIKGKASQDDILNENSHIYYCPNCNSTYSKSGNKDEYCPECGQLLSETTILTEDWRKYPSSRKEGLKQDFTNGQFLRRNIGMTNATGYSQYSSADELKKYKELLDSGAITEDEYDIKKKQILGL